MIISLEQKVHDVIFQRESLIISFFAVFTDS